MTHEFSSVWQSYQLKNKVSFGTKTDRSKYHFIREIQRNKKPKNKLINYFFNQQLASFLIDPFFPVFHKSSFSSVRNLVFLFKCQSEYLNYQIGFLIVRLKKLEWSQIYLMARETSWENLFATNVIVCFFISITIACWATEIERNYMRFQLARASFIT